MSVQYGQMKNGLPYVKIPMADTRAACLLLLVRAGSRLENNQEGGLSHFLEHMIFKGTAKWPTALDLSQVLDSVGAEYNAFTSKEYTGYYIKVAADYLPLASEVMTEMIWRSKFEPEEMAKEKKVITEEINMYEDNPLMYIGDVLENEIYKGSSLGKLISGTRESVGALSHQQLVNYWSKYYHPKNMLLIAAGKLTKKGIAAVNKNFGVIKKTGTKGTFTSITPKYKLPRLALHYKDTQQVQLAVAFPSFGHNYKKNLAIGLLANIMGGNMSSRLFTRLREHEGLCYSIRCGVETYYGTGLFVVQAGLDKSRLPLALKALKQELAKIKKEKITTTELKKAKEYVKGSLVLNLEDSMSQAQWVARRLFLENDKTNLDAFLKKVEAVTVKDISQMANKIIKFNQATLALIGPFKNKAAILKLWQ